MVAAAKRAFMVSDKCPEAYVLLTYEKDAAEGKPLLEKALALAEELVGRQTIDQPGVDLLEVEDGPAYLMCRKTLGFCLATLRDEERALLHLKAVAALDPQDGIGVGHTLLLSFLVRGEEEDNENAWQIAQAQSCTCPYHLYSRALLSFRREDPGAESEELLRQALLANPHVPLFLFGVLEMPEDPPTAHEVAEDGWLSGQTAAGAYASAALVAWEDTPGALEWLELSMAGLATELRQEIGEQLRELGLEEILESVFTGEVQGLAWSHTQRREDPSWVFVCREPDRESEALARYRQALELLLQQRAAARELRTERSSETDGFTFFTVIGSVYEILELVEDLMDDVVGGFSVCTYRRKDEIVFEDVGAEVVMKETGPPLDLSEYFPR